MQKDYNIALLDMISCLSSAVDLVSPALFEHQKRVAYIAATLAAELGFCREKQSEFIMAGALHDIGGMPLQESVDLLQFEVEDWQRHAEVGYLHLNSFPPFKEIAQLVRYHHVPWVNGKGAVYKGQTVPLGSHLLHLADKVDSLIDRKGRILDQVEAICAQILMGKGDAFVPEFVDAFLQVAQREAFWLDTVSMGLGDLLAHSPLSRASRLAKLELNLDGLVDLARFFSQIIDFRSRFTAVHSSGVAAVATALARLVGLSERECKLITIAGYLHDLGKLAVPVEILEKPGRLSQQEFRVIKAHTFYTYRILERIPELHIVAAWAAYHHERLDGEGYPFKLKGADLTFGSRIMAVADVYTAVTEDRPYRAGMMREQVVGLLQAAAQQGALDGRLVATLLDNYEHINGIRLEAQTQAFAYYRQFEQLQ